MKMDTKSKKHIEGDDCDTKYDEEIMPIIIQYVLTHYNLKQGIAKFGEKVEKAIEKELSEIHNMNALKPLDASILTVDEKKNVITSMIF